MPELRACFESAGFTNVRTVLSSGNVAFDSPLANPADIESRAEASMGKTLGQAFYTVVRSSVETARTLGDRSVSRPWNTGLRQACGQLFPCAVCLKGFAPVGTGSGLSVLGQRSRGLHRVHTNRQGASVHDADREGVWQERHYAHAGYRCQVCGGMTRCQSLTREA